MQKDLSFSYVQALQTITKYIQRKSQFLTEQLDSCHTTIQSLQSYLSQPNNEYPPVSLNLPPIEERAKIFDQDEAAFRSTLDKLFLQMTEPTQPISTAEQTSSSNPLNHDMPTFLPFPSEDSSVPLQPKPKSTVKFSPTIRSIDPTFASIHPHYRSLSLPRSFERSRHSHHHRLSPHPTTTPPPPTAFTYNYSYSPNPASTYPSRLSSTSLSPFNHMNYRTPPPLQEAIPPAGQADQPPQEPHKPTTDQQETSNLTPTLGSNQQPQTTSEPSILNPFFDASMLPQPAAIPPFESLPPIPQSTPSTPPARRRIFSLHHGSPSRQPAQSLPRYPPYRPPPPSQVPSSHSPSTPHRMSGASFQQRIAVTPPSPSRKLSFHPHG